MLFEGGTLGTLIDGWAGTGSGSRCWFGGGLDAAVKTQLSIYVHQHVVLKNSDQGRSNLALCSEGSSVEGAFE